MPSVLAELRTIIDREVGSREKVLADIQKYTRDLQQKTIRKGNVLLTQALVQLAAKETQEQVQGHLQDIVQTAIDTVFPGAYLFKADFNTSAGRTVVDMYLDKDGTPMDPMDSNGYGVLDVISFALRIACWAISDTDNVLLLDEPFKHIRGRPRMLLGEMVQKSSHKLQLQIIMVADVSDTGIEADREFKVVQKNRKSRVERVL